MNDPDEAETPDAPPPLRPGQFTLKRLFFWQFCAALVLGYLVMTGGFGFMSLVCGAAVGTMLAGFYEMIRLRRVPSFPLPWDIRGAVAGAVAAGCSQLLFGESFTVVAVLAAGILYAPWALVNMLLRTWR